MDATILPSKAISDQYGSQQVLTNQAQIIVGRVVEIGNEIYVYTIDPDAKPVVLSKEDIEQITASQVSQMPTGLIDGLNAEELKDLVAYILASGDQRSAVYRK